MVNFIVIPVGGEDGKYVYIDSSLKGTATSESPLGISNAYKTGTYAPVDEILEELPAKPDKGKGYRVITKETFSDYGRLYTFDEVEKIKQDISASGWRVPTKKDWDKMLNSIELADENRTHGEDGPGTKDLGADAGAFLKSVDDNWTFDDEAKGEDNYGFKVLPLGKVSEHGYVKDSYHNRTWFWADSKVDGDVYAKGFDFNKRTVSQELVSSNQCKCSLRLVRDYANDADCEFEEIINGVTMPCVLMPKSRQVWTSANFGLVSTGRYEGEVLSV